MHRSSEWEGKPPSLRLNYQYQISWNNMVNAVLQKYDWESRYTFTAVESARQVDADTVEWTRKLETVNGGGRAEEVCRVNRKDKTMICENLYTNNDATKAVTDRHLFVPTPDGHTSNVFESFHYQSNELKLEQFKIGIARTIKAFKFV